MFTQYDPQIPLPKTKLKKEEYIDYLEIFKEREKKERK